MENKLIKRKENLINIFIKKIKNFFLRKNVNTVEEKEIINNNIIDETKDREISISYEELQEIQYELETGRLTEKDLSQEVLKQVIELYDKQIKNIRHENYEKIQQIDAIKSKLINLNV